MSDDVENQRVTIAPTPSRHRDHAGDTTLTIRRTLSIHTPAVPPSSRLPIEFRTLSLHLEHTKKSDHSNNGSKGAVKGQHLARPHPAPVSPMCRKNVDPPPFRPVRSVRTRLAYYGSRGNGQGTTNGQGHMSL